MAGLGVSYFKLFYVQYIHTQTRKYPSFISGESGIGTYFWCPHPHRWWSCDDRNEGCFVNELFL